MYADESKKKTTYFHLKNTSTTQLLDVNVSVIKKKSPLQYSSLFNAICDATASNLIKYVKCTFC